MNQKRETNSEENIKIDVIETSLKSQLKDKNSTAKESKVADFEKTKINEKNTELVETKEIKTVENSKKPESMEEIVKIAYSNEKNSKEIESKEKITKSNNIKSKVIENEINEKISKEIESKEKITESNDKKSKNIVNKKKRKTKHIEINNEKNSKEIKINEKIPKGTESNDTRPKEINEKNESEEINLTSEEKSTKNSEKKNECRKSDVFENKKRFLNDNTIVKKFSFSIPRKETIRVKKRVEEFYIFGNEDYSEEDDLAYLSKIKPKGLRNIGGCCYMNSTLQCFYHIKEFTDYFLKNKKKIKSKNGPISTGLLDVIEGLSQKGFDAYIPEKFKSNLFRIDNSFRGTEGKDSGDLTLLILNECHEELLNNYSDLPNMSLDQREESTLFLDIFLKDAKESSIIRDLFTYYIRVKNICFECGTIFYSLSLNNMMIFSLEQVFRMNGSDISMKKEKRVVSIENCLSCFSFDGTFEKKTFNCKYCKKNAHLFSVKSFATLPRYLIMQMKRGKNEKFECNVDFEENIDLEDSYINVKGAPKENNAKYTLIGGTILYGKGGYGHTVAFCKHFDGQYYIFNDSTFSKTYLNEIKQQKIYLLFYQKNND